MKLDRLKFAELIGYCANRGMTIDYSDVRVLDNLTEMNVEPVEVPGKADLATINELMRAIHGGEKIAAIKAYRSLTGFGFKESKDAVEKDWERKYGKHELNKKLGKLNPPLDVVRFVTVKEFINKLDNY